MEKSQNLRSSDTSKYNLRCNRNVSEKMTKKDFIYDIPTPFQAMRNKDKSLSSVQLKRPRGDFVCSLTQRGSGKSDGKLNNKNPIGVLRLIQQRKLIPAVTTANCNSSNSLINPAQSREEIKERILKEPERANSGFLAADGTAAVAGEMEKEIRRQIVLPIQLRRKIGSVSKPPRYSVIPTCNEEKQLSNSNGHQLPERKILGYQCNYCGERVATFMSLSTHVKYHYLQKHCNTCFWILEPRESMSQHIQKIHPTFPNVPAVPNQM